jgi:hypothetical protein
MNDPNTEPNIVPNIEPNIEPAGSPFSSPSRKSNSGYSADKSEAASPDVRKGRNKGIEVLEPCKFEISEQRK